ncbi:MAG: anthranilate phosphoribosyltransferase [Candidatus Marinimicrobia bacterium]|nr:anthranilate phosphoribosyltransferase [Candidatus Neomarinimicrobiota bacterium]
MMKPILEQLLDKKHLSREQAYNLMSSIMSGEYDDIQTTGILIALRAKGETVDEITGFADVMRRKMLKISLNKPAIDLCGTGGDSLGTFNISTVASFVVAGSGVHVAKHGNRSMTSKSGSADVLQALGIPINLPPEQTAENIDRFGLGFMFAPLYHPAMKHAVNARKSLAIRTVFNILGPLCNPADVKAQAMGIFDPDLTELQAKVLKRLESTNIMVFHGRDGLDEISTTSKTKISQVINGGSVNSYEFNPLDLGITIASIDDLRGGDSKKNADISIKILSGEKGPKRDIVLLNAAAGIVVGGNAKDLKEGFKKAADSIDSGSALNILRKLAE